MNLDRYMVKKVTHAPQSRLSSNAAAALIAAALAVAAGLLALPAEKTPLTGTPELIQTLDRLNVLGSVLMIAAHPDDENTNVIAYFARGRHIRTAYLSATRGEGGQNLLGTEQNEAMGLIRTQELLAARRIDGGEQFFTRAYDFGFSKSPEEALQKWGRDRLLSDFVRIIRRFRPDVIIDRWPPPPGSGGHGQHTATGYIAPEAFAAAADPKQFPEQMAEHLQPWRARRLVWNTFSFNRRQEVTEEQAADRIRVDAGGFDPVLGKSYAEIAGESRSEHWSQGQGTPERRGPSLQFFVQVAGERVNNPPTSDLFEGIDTTWGRVEGAARLGQLFSQARRELVPDQPEKILPLLVAAYTEMERLHDPWVDVKRPELLHAIDLAAGLWLDAEADRWNVVPGSSLDLTLTAINRSHFPLTWERTEIKGVAGQTTATSNRPLEFNNPQQFKATVNVPPNAPFSQPYWMRELRTADYYPVSDPNLIGMPENPPVLEATFYLRTAQGVVLPMRAPVQYRWIERAGGEKVRAVEVVPPVAVSFTSPAMVFPEARPRPVIVRITSSVKQAKGTVSLEAPVGWKVAPAAAPFEISDPNQQLAVRFEVTPPARAGGGHMTARAQIGGTTVSAGMVSIQYPHIPPQTYFPPARTRVERFDVRLTAKNIGYVMGAGDEVPQALEQLGASVHLLTAEDLAAGDLRRFDAIVTGIRALNVRDDLIAARQRLLDYVAGGGTLVVQYNTSDARSGDRAAALAPYPLTPSAQRTTVEEAPVSFPNPDLPVLHRPNEITARDFEGWVQERGLYFMSGWDPHYQPVFESHDPGEKPQLGGTLYARYGQGVYIYTSYAWFRQLPAGVPGAYRVFANLVSGGK
jgi:LmbE family N-acetylglucosaminyl deacetylase